MIIIRVILELRRNHEAGNVADTRRIAWAARHLSPQAPGFGIWGWIEVEVVYLHDGQCGGQLQVAVGMSLALGFMHEEKLGGGREVFGLHMGKFSL